MRNPLTPLQFARRARRLYPEREAVVDGALRLTYRQFLERCDRWSAVLQGWGVGAGERVLVVAPNTHAMLEQFYAVPQLGAIIVPVNYRLSVDDFRYLIGHCAPVVVCAHRDYLGMLETLRPELPGVRYFVALEGAAPGWEDYETLLAAAAPEEFEPAAVDEDDVLSINYTSGTTSRPKGVMITHRNAWMNFVGTLVHYPLRVGERYLWTLPMFHANGWTFVWTVTAAGGTHLCLRRVDAAGVYAHVSAEGATMLCAAPTVLIAIANGPEAERRRVPRGVRVLTAGAPPAAATIARIEGELGWEVTHIYGLTETAPFILVCEQRPEHAALEAAASATLKARQGVELITSGELQVVDEAGREVPHDGETLGEIVVRGNVVMLGYYRDPEASARALRGGWFHTGDAAVVHPDGYVEIRDRFKDVIISGGENISSIELEGVLLSHPAVHEAAVVGMPHEKWGETPVAHVVLRPGAHADPEELRAHCRGRLAHFKVPSAVHLVAELPKTATGKIQKFVLRGGRSAISRQ
ncbi:MAG: long-chain-fatty-acid--CoA ligase [Gammaproteobacteria bacterium]|nr:long-chain-fatty-acid--CoA ligase [Gammaproteobacteria bacterium]